MKKAFIFFIASFLGLSAYAVKPKDYVSINVVNPLDDKRMDEMLELNANDIKVRLAKLIRTDADNVSFIITDAEGNEVPTQITHDGKLIFPVTITSKGKNVYYAKQGTPQKYEPKVMGRLFTERQDEFGWENDRVAYRIYGHGAAVGYDLFNKSTDRLMLNHWYASEQDKEMRSVSKKLHDRGYHELADQVYNAFCYHIDHGEGMDCYTVGPTLGAGADALVKSDGTLQLPMCYKNYEILDNGPLRFTVRLTYPEQTFEGNKVTETRIISLDAGSLFCRANVIFNGTPANARLATGVVVHKQNPEAYVMNSTLGYVGYEDLGDGSPYNSKYRAELEKQMGRIYVGTVYESNPDEVRYVEGNNGIAVGHALAFSTLPQNGYSYYFGNVWDGNKSLGINSLKTWENVLSHKSLTVRNPLKVSIK